MASNSDNYVRKFQSNLHTASVRCTAQALALEACAQHWHVYGPNDHDENHDHANRMASYSDGNYELWVIEPMVIHVVLKYTALWNMQYLGFSVSMHLKITVKTIVWNVVLCHRLWSSFYSKQWCGAHWAKGETLFWVFQSWWSNITV